MKNRMHVAFVISRPYVGAFPCYREPIRFLADRGVKVDVYATLSDMNPPPVFLHDNIHLALFTISRFGVVELIWKLATHRPKYDWIFAVPQWDVYFAQKAASLAAIPVVYISDELYLEEEATTDLQRKWKKRERKAHAKCAFTISYSPELAEFIRVENQLPEGHEVYAVRATSPGPAERKRSRYYQDKLGIPEENFVLLYAGSWWWRKFFPDLEKILASVGDGVDIVFDGRYVDSSTKRLTSKNIHCCNTVASDDVLNDVVSSAHVGLALYQDTPISSKLICTGSGKLSLYMKNGLPVIITYQDAFRWIEDEGCGVCIGSVEEIPDALAKIRMNYDWYVSNVVRYYSEVLEFGRNFEIVYRNLLLKSSNVGHEVQGLSGFAWEE